MFTDINSEDRLVQATFAKHLEKVLGWESVYAWNDETFGADGTLGRADTREVVLTRDLRAALGRLNPQLPPCGGGSSFERADPTQLLAVAASAQSGILPLHPRRRAGELSRRARAASPCAGARD
jgi:hypothetical protein